MPVNTVTPKQPPKKWICVWNRYLFSAAIALKPGQAKPRQTNSRQTQGMAPAGDSLKIVLQLCCVVSRWSCVCLLPFCPLFAASRAKVHKFIQASNKKKYNL